MQLSQIVTEYNQNTKELKYHFVQIRMCDGSKYDGWFIDTKYPFATFQEIEEAGFFVNQDHIASIALLEEDDDKSG